MLNVLRTELRFVWDLIHVGQKFIKWSGCKNYCTELVFTQEILPNKLLILHPDECQISFEKMLCCFSLLASLDPLNGQSHMHTSYLNALKKLIGHVSYKRLVLSFLFSTLAFQVGFLGHRFLKYIKKWLNRSTK